MPDKLPRVGWEARQRTAMREHDTFKQAVIGRRGVQTSTKGPAGMLNTRAQAYKLSPEVFLQAYTFSPYIRPCVDGISRTIKGKQWDIEPNDGRDVRDLTTTEQAQRKVIIEKFNDPNQNKGAWQTFIGLVNMDCLIYDAPAIELVFGDGSGKLLEMVPVYGPSIHPIIDKHGMLEKYVQKIGLEKDQEFEPDQMIFAPMYSSTRSPYGLSLIQTCVEQITYLLLMADHHSRILDRDEIPEGIAFASGIDNTTWNKFILDARRAAGMKGRFHAIGIQQPQGKVDWIQFKRSSKEEQLMEIGQEAERIIVRNFGIDPTTAGLHQRYGSRDRSEVEQAATDSGLIVPVCNHYEEHFTLQIVHKYPGGELFRFKFLHPKERDRLKAAQATDKLTRGGHQTINEGRMADGLEPYESAPYASRPFIQVPGVGLIFLDTGEVLGGKEASPVEPSALLEGAGRSSVLVQSAKVKGYTNASRVENLIGEYTKALKDAFEQFGREAQAIIHAGLLENEPIEMSRAQRDEKVGRLKVIREKYWGLWGNILNSFAPKAALMGRDRAYLKIRQPYLSDEEREFYLRGLINENHKFMKDAWRKYTDRLIWVVNRGTKDMHKTKGPGGLPDDIEFDNLTQMIKAEEAAMVASLASVEAYGRYMWAVENVIYAREAQAASLKVYWHQVSYNPCPDCSSVADQVWEVKELNFFPGEGTTCDGQCHCFLEILEKGETV